MIGVYKIESPSGAVYIGQSWDIEKRIDSYRNRPKKSQAKIYASLKKYGFKNHAVDVLHELPNDTTQDVMNNYEYVYLNQYKGLGFIMMNIREAGSNGKLSEDTKRKMSLSGKEQVRQNPERYRRMLDAAIKAVKGKPHSEIHRKRISEGQKGKKLSDAHCISISVRMKKWVSDNPEWLSEFKRKGVEASTGIKRPPHVIEAIRKAHLGVKKSAEQVNFLRNINKGRKHTKEVVEKKILNSTLNKPVLQFTKKGVFIKEWSGAPLVERTLGIKRTSICACINKKRKSAGGYIWKPK